MKKRFFIPFDATSCSIALRPERDLRWAFYAFKIDFPKIENPESLAESTELKWSPGLNSLYRYSRSAKGGETMYNSPFKLPAGCTEVIIEPVQWKDRANPIPTPPFELVVKANWSGSNVVTIFGEPLND